MSESYLIWSGLVGILLPIACGCVLPIVIVLLVVRQRMNESKNQAQIAMAAIEKHPEMDVEELMKKISPKKKLQKEKLLSKLLWGCIIGLLGVSLLILGLCMILGKDYDPDDSLTAITFGLILVGIGIAFLVNYRMGQKMLAKEIEAEENQMTKQA